MEENLKQLLLKDLCARLPYGVYITWDGKNPISITPSIYNAIWLKQDFKWKSYLRPLSSMTEKEREYYYDIMACQPMWASNASELVDWLNAHHFDYRGLIEKGLAIEAPNGMYK